ncbi:MAG: NAD kinase [Bacteroidales bacterium]|nr:NAD kinase [Bacteroidales bacterium]
MKIALYSKAFQKGYEVSVGSIMNKLHRCGAEVLIYAPFRDFLESSGQVYSFDAVYTGHHDLPRDVDFLLSIGGDGTLLSSVSVVRDSMIPIAGINSGRLGFLSSISSSGAERLIDDLQSGNYVYSDRSLIQLDNPWGIFQSDFNCALNEVTLQKRGTPLMLTHVYCNGDFLNTYWSDGLIISTPTGSTAYSMSVGGPVIMPQAEAFVISPISPHNLNVRPMVIPNDSILEMKTESRTQRFITTIDTLSEETDCSREIKLSLAPFRIRLIESSLGYFSTLRAKLMWGADKRVR